LAPLAALLLGYNLQDIFDTLLNAKGRFFTSWQRLLTEGRVLVHYLSLLFFPAPGRFALVQKFRISQTLFGPITTLFSWVFILGLIVLAIKQRKRFPLFAVAVLWFFSNHLLESSIIPLEIAFLHRNYIPALFLFLPLAVLVATLAERRPVTWLPVMLLIPVLCSGQIARAGKWGDPELFWSDAVSKAPGSLRGYINLGIIHDLRGEEQKALGIYERASGAAFEEDQGSWADLYVNIGIALMKLGRDNEAEPYLDKALAITLNDDYLFNMAHLQLRLGNREKLWKSLKLLERNNARYPDLHLLKAKAYVAEKRYSDAREELEIELRFYPGNQPARSLLYRLPR
jgi:tetratricopeptide (TPR) repeat protein